MPSCHRFVCKNNGVLFENQLLQIGIKSEYRQNLGKLLYHVKGGMALLFTDFPWAGIDFVTQRAIDWGGGILYFIFHKAQAMSINRMFSVSQGECTYSMATKLRCSLPVSPPQSAVPGSCSLISFLTCVVMCQHVAQQNTKTDI